MLNREKRRLVKLVNIVIYHKEKRITLLLKNHGGGCGKSFFSVYLRYYKLMLYCDNFDNCDRVIGLNKNG